MREIASAGREDRGDNIWMNGARGSLLETQETCILLYYGSDRMLPIIGKKLSR